MNWETRTKKEECPFCKTNAKVIENTDILKSVFNYCLCGYFIFDRIAREDIYEYEKILKTDEDKILFSGYLRNNQTTTITEKFISEELLSVLDYCQQIPLDKKYLK